MPAYRWLVVYTFLSPLYVFLTDWTPIGRAVTLQVIVLILMRLTSDRQILGGQANGRPRNVRLALTLRATVCGGAEWIFDLVRGKGGG